MSTPATPPKPDADQPRNSGWRAEFVTFLREHKLWWLLPIAIVLAAFVALAILSGTGAAPFIYTPR